MRTMFCKHCGKEISEDSQYCNFCGKGQKLTAWNAFVIKTINNKSFEKYFVATMGGLLYSLTALIMLKFLFFLKNSIISLGVGFLFFCVAFISLVRYDEDGDWNDDI